MLKNHRPNPLRSHLQLDRYSSKTGKLNLPRYTGGRRAITEMPHLLMFQVQQTRVNVDFIAAHLNLERI